MSAFLTTLLRLSLLGSALAVLLFLLKPLLRGKVSRTVQYYLWLLVLLRLCVPAGLTLPLPAEAPRVPIPIAAETAPAPRVEPVPKVQTQAQAQAPALAERGIAPETALFLLWAAGAGGFALWYLLSYWSIRRKLYAAASAPRPEAVALLKEAEPRGRVRLIASGAVDTPLLLGLLHPVIVLPAAPIPPAQLRDIFAHELTHVRRGDLLYKWFAAFAACIHWFNPLAYGIRREVGRTCELACDEAVIKTLDAPARQHYGETLLQLSAPARPLPLAVTMCEEKRNLKERLVSIVKIRKKGPWTVLLSLVLVAVVACCALFISAAPRVAAEQFRTPSGYLTLEMGMPRKEVDKQLYSQQSEVQTWGDALVEAVTYETPAPDKKDPVTVYYAYSARKETDVVIGIATQEGSFSWNSRCGGTWGQTVEELQALYPEGRVLTVSAGDGGEETMFYVPFLYWNECQSVLTFFFDQDGRVDAMTMGDSLNPYLEPVEHFYNAQRQTILFPGMSREAVEASLGQGQPAPEEDPMHFTLDWREVFPKGVPAFYRYGTGADQVLVGYLEDEAIVLSVCALPSHWKVRSGVTTGDKRSAMKQYKYLKKYGDIDQVWSGSALLSAHTDARKGILRLDLTSMAYASTLDTQEYLAPDPFCNEALGVTVNLNMTKAEVEERLGQGTAQGDGVSRYGTGADALEVRYQRGYVVGLQAGSGDGEPFRWKTQSGIGCGSSVKQAGKKLSMHSTGSGEGSGELILVPTSMNIGLPFFSGLATQEQGVVQLTQRIVWDDEEYNDVHPFVGE